VLTTPRPLEEHQRILEALRCGDAAAARQLLWEHLERTTHYISKYLPDRRSKAKRLAEPDAAQRSHQI